MQCAVEEAVSRQQASLMGKSWRLTMLVPLPHLRLSILNIVMGPACRHDAPLPCADVSKRSEEGVGLAFIQER